LGYINPANRNIMVTPTKSPVFIAASLIVEASLTEPGAKVGVANDNAVKVVADKFWLWTVEEASTVAEVK
jgi:hypothetical protein